MALHTDRKLTVNTHAWRTCHLDLSQPDDVRPALKRLDEERVGDAQHDAWSEQQKKKQVITRENETSVDRFPKLRL